MHSAGYLLLNSNLAEANAPLPPNMQILPLSDEEWRQLTFADRFIRSVNARLLGTLSKELGAPLVAVCDPYERLRQGEYHPGVGTGEIPECDTPVEQLAQFFLGHPSIGVVKISQAILSKLPAEKLSGFVEWVNSVMEQEEGRPTEDDLSGFLGTRKASKAENDLGRAGANLYAIRKAISIIDGLLFDAFAIDRLVVLSDANCFSVGHGRDRLGRTARIELQPVANEIGREPGHLVLIKLPEEHYPGLSGPALIESEQISFDRETGMTMTLELRPLDSWLQPYPGILYPR